jgi:hypothetical protein
MKPIFNRKVMDDHNIFYDEDISLGEDLLLYSKLIASGARFGLTNIAMYLYAIRKTSISSKPKLTMELVKVNKRIEEYYFNSSRILTDEKYMKHFFKARKIALLWQVFAWAVKIGDFRQAGILLCKIPISFFALQVCQKSLDVLKHKIIKRIIRDLSKN